MDYEEDTNYTIQLSPEQKDTPVDQQSIAKSHFIDE